MTLKHNDSNVPRMNQAEFNTWFENMIKYTHYGDLVLLRDMLTVEIDKTRAEISGVAYEPRTK